MTLSLSLSIELERGRMAVIEDDDGSSKAEENAKYANVPSVIAL